MRLVGLLVFSAALSACADRSYTPTLPEALTIGTPYRVFAATTRAKNPDGSFGYERSDTLRRLELTVSIPPSHTPGGLNFGYANPNPHTQFTMAGRKEFATPQAFQKRLRQVIDALPYPEREVTVFIHGYNETLPETAFRAAQLAYDVRLTGALVIYSWPSKGRPLGYAYDIDSALFARDGLKQLLFELRATSKRPVLLVAHSLGSLLMMETLRQIDLRRPGWVGTNIGGVVLISPDLDVDLFRRQMKSLSQVPQPFVIFVSGQDKVLNVSARLRGDAKRERLGSISHISKVADLPIQIIDTTAFSDEAESSHFVAGSSPALIAMLSQARPLNNIVQPEQPLFNALYTGNSEPLQGAVKVNLLLQMDSPR